MNLYKILNFKHFPNIIGQPITIDENTLFFKSYNTNYDPLIDKRPSFFGEIDNATKYLNSDKKLGIFSITRKIKLLDIRYISQIINDLILLRHNNDFETIIKGYLILALSFGLISLYKQLNLYKNRYSSTLNTDLRYKKIIKYYNDYENAENKELFQNPIELQGIRIGEINNDIESTFILKEIFETFFDGFICPTIVSPYFDENFIPNEILLFNPLNCIKEIDNIPKNTISININEILSNNNINLFSVPYFMKDNESTYFKYGGYLKNKLNIIDYIFEKNNLINNLYVCKKNVKLFKKLKKQGNEFKKNMLYNKILNKKIKGNDYLFDKNNKISNTI